MLLWKEVKKQLEAANELMNKAYLVKQTLNELDEIKEKLKGYADIAKTAESAEGSDPLAPYYELAADIKTRADKTHKYSAGKSDIKIEDTTHSREFRQRACGCF